MGRVADKTFKEKLNSLILGKKKFGVIVVDEYQGITKYKEAEGPRLMIVNLAQNTVLARIAKSEHAVCWNICYFPGYEQTDNSEKTEVKGHPRHLMLPPSARTIVKPKPNVFEQSYPSFDQEVENSGITAAIVMGYATNGCVADCIAGTNHLLPMYSDGHGDGLVGRGIEVHTHSALLRGDGGNPKGWEKRDNVFFYEKFG